MNHPPVLPKASAPPRVVLRVASRYPRRTSRSRSNLGIAVDLLHAGQALEHLGQICDFLLAQRLEKAILCGKQSRPKLSEFPRAPRRQLDDMGSPILWVTLPEDPASGLQRVEI